MGRYATAPALLVLMFTAACSGAGATQSALDLPADAEILIPETRGGGSTDLPVFKPETDVYTIYATCTGKGRMTIVDRNNPGDDPSKIGCNGPITVGRVFTEITTQKLSVQIRGGTANWTLAVVSGEHPV
ncbi:hypothetical protein I2W78_23110 [Streptomyces spinoverrucosus]|uniref:hypothetical protein n=1 Tax=Streptomyces spinoverrucosus TaxID=284043 RepID=UPI0018C3B2C6|nr:hypothetical protein [Streptomyces spinoverrucosus]MBG0854652.1 hypothetical protein [Streptomyces spinoverrucosus]